MTYATFQPWPEPSARRHRSFWLEQALITEPDAENTAQRLEGQQHADVCIVGGGYTGLWTAIRLKELDPVLDVTIVEADICGAGASGRNGGIAVGWLWRIPTLLGFCGGEDTARLVRASISGIDDIETVCREEGIDAHFKREGWYWTATNRAQIGAWQKALETADALGLEVMRVVQHEDLTQRLGSKTHVAGVLDTSAATIQPALLVRGLRRVALRLGVRIFEKSPVLRVKRGIRPSVHSRNGAVDAERIVLAANAWMVHLRAFRRRVFQVSSNMIATEPILSRLREHGWTSNASWSDSRMNVNYVRPTADGRIAFGRAGGTLAFRGRIDGRFDHSPKETRFVTSAFQRVFPTFGDVGITHAWSGPIDRSVSGLPWFDALERDERVICAMGYSGTGVAPSAMGGRIIASLVLERDDEWSSLGMMLRRFQPQPTLPPEPIRYIGGRIVQIGVARKERAEDRGRRPSRIAAALAGLVPAPLVDRRSSAHQTYRTKASPP